MFETSLSLICMSCMIACGPGMAECLDAVLSLYYRSVLYVCVVVTQHVLIDEGTKPFGVLSSHHFGVTGEDVCSYSSGFSRNVAIHADRWHALGRLLSPDMYTCNSEACCRVYQGGMGFT